MDVLRLFRDNGALLDGHFLLSSGLHSAQYMQCAMILQHPSQAEKLGKALAEVLPWQADTVIAPAMGGLIIGHEVAKALGKRMIFAERVNGNMTLKRGLTIHLGEKVIIVDDVITTGGSTKEVFEMAVNQGAEVSGIAAIIDRSGGKIAFNAETRTLAIIDIPVHKPQECPMCKQGMPVIKPGSRQER